MAHSVVFYEQLYPMDTSDLAASQLQHPLFTLESSTPFALKPGDLFDAASWMCDGKPCKFRIVRLERQAQGTASERVLVFVNVVRGTSPLRPFFTPSPATA